MKITTEIRLLKFIPVEKLPAILDLFAMYDKQPTLIDYEKAFHHIMTKQSRQNHTNRKDKKRERQNKRGGEQR